MLMISQHIGLVYFPIARRQNSYGKNEQALQLIATALLDGGRSWML